MNRKIRISIVDDMDINRAVMRALLVREFEVTDYADGPSALEGLAGEPPDLVLLDISMPGMDGYEVLQRLRADPRLCDVVVVAFTALAVPEDTPRFQAFGFDDCIPKPIVDFECLSGRLRGLIAQRATRPCAATHEY